MNVEIELNKTVNKTNTKLNYVIHNFLDTISLGTVRSEKKTAIFVGKGTMKAVMRDNDNAQREMCSSRGCSHDCTKSYPCSVNDQKSLRCNRTSYQKA